MMMNKIEGQVAAPVVTRSQRKISQDSRSEAELEQSEPGYGQPQINRQLIVMGTVANTKVRCLCDPGATLSFIKDELVEKLHPTPQIYQSDVAIVLGDGAESHSKGYIKTPVILNGVALDVRLHLLSLPENFQVILGMDALSRHKCILDASG
eukprot:SAG11_NODE_947_length_6417_cov_1.986705_7_plen_152_part_00